MAQAPNFLLIMTDQQRADHLGCAGNPLLRTPHLDGLAARGTRFTRCHVATPICMPNRASIMTGRMPSLHGVRDNGIPLSVEATTFVELLRAAGWQTALIGKSHLQNYLGLPPLHAATLPPGKVAPPAELAEAVHHSRTGPDYDRENTKRWLADPDYDPVTPFYGFDFTRLCTRHSDQVQGPYTRWLLSREPQGNALRAPANALPDPRYSAPQARRTRLPEELYPTNYIANETIAYLERHAAQDGDAPFFVQCSFTDPHHPFTPPGRFWDMYAPEDVQLPPSFDMPHDQTPILAGIHQELRHGQPDRTFQRPFAVTRREAQEMIALTYGMIALVDEAVGRILARLDELGLAENTVVLFTSDHGDWMGDHALMLKGPLHYAGMVRVPLIWSDPQRTKAPATSDVLCSSIDISATVLGRAGLHPYAGMQGLDLAPALDGAALPRSAVMIEQETDIAYLGCDPGIQGPLATHTLVTERYRLSLWREFTWGELYDLQEDPHEMRNLWDSPEHATIRATLMERLARTLIDYQDRAPARTGLA